MGVLSVSVAIFAQHRMRRRRCTVLSVHGAARKARKFGADWQCRWRDARAAACSGCRRWRNIGKQAGECSACRIYSPGGSRRCAARGPPRAGTWSVACLSHFSASLRCVLSCRSCKHCIRSSARSWHRSRSGALQTRCRRCGVLLGTNGDFAAALNAWFDDRVGFRALFIRVEKSDRLHAVRHFQESLDRFRRLAVRSLSRRLRSRRCPVGDFGKGLRDLGALAG